MDGTLFQGATPMEIGRAVGTASPVTENAYRVTEIYESVVVSMDTTALETAGVPSDTSFARER